MTLQNVHETKAETHKRLISALGAQELLPLIEFWVDQPEDAGTAHYLEAAFDEVKEQMMERAFVDATERQRKMWLQELRRGVYIDVRL